MYMRLTQIALSLLLIVGIADAFAQPRGERAAAFAFYAQDRGPQPNEQQQRDNDRRRNREFSTSGFGANGENASNNPPPDYSRRQGKLSPEERRALRRQIDEAGHDIYTPKR